MWKRELELRERISFFTSGSRALSYTKIVLQVTFMLWTGWTIVYFIGRVGWNIKKRALGWTRMDEMSIWIA